jgi:hypothetical protein
MMDHSANTGIAKVRAALQRGDSLTHMDALRRFGLWSLATAIHSLKGQGMAIHSRLINVRTSTGNLSRVALYSLDPEASHPDEVCDA